MNILINTINSLQDQLLTDPKLALVAAISALDSYGPEPDDDSTYIDYDGDDDDCLDYAMRTLRRVAPPIYCTALRAIHEGKTTPQIESLIAHEFFALSIPNIDLQCLANGYVPLDAQGVAFNGEDGLENHPELIPVLRLFQPDYSIESDSYQTRVSAEATQAAYYIIMSLEDNQERSIYKALLALLDWLFSTSGNTLIDCTSLDETEPMQWDGPDTVAFASEICAEAEQNYNDAQSALALLDERPELLEELKTNIALVRTHIQEKGLLDTYDIRSYRYPLEWHY